MPFKKYEKELNYRHKFKKKLSKNGQIRRNERTTRAMTCLLYIISAGDKSTAIIKELVLLDGFVFDSWASLN